MTGKHLTEDQVVIYRATRQAHTSQHAARIASISRSSASRIDNGLWAPQKHRTRRTRRSKLSGVWDGDALPYLAENPRASAKDVYLHLRDVFPLLISAAQRRTIERQYKRWQNEHGFIPLGNLTFLHSAHQGYLDMSLFGEQEINSPDLPLLIRSAKSLPLKKRNRAMLALAVLQRIPLVQMCRYLRISKSTAKRWEKIFQDGGAKALLFPDTARSPKCVSEAVNGALFKVLHCPPPSYGFARTNWRAIDLKAAMGTEGVVTSLWTIRRAIRQAGYRWKKAKVSLTSNDPRYIEKVKKITSILENLTDDEAFFSVDEYGPFSLRSMKGLRLVGPDETPSVPQWQKTRGSLIITAAVELKTNQITHFYSNGKNTQEMIAMIERLRRAYAEQKTLYISWDAASWHMSKALDERVTFLNEWAEHDKAPIIELAPLPSKAQFLNVIESIFSGLARAVIHNSDFTDLDDAKHMIDEYLANRNDFYFRHPRRAGNKIWGKERHPAVFDESRNHKDPRYR
jgi:transposase